MASFYPKHTKEGSPLDVGRVAASLRSGAQRQETLARKASNPPTPSQLLHRSLIAKENSSEDVLRIAEEKLFELDANNCATAIHKVAQLGRRRSTGLTSVGRDLRFQHLLDMAVENTSAWTSRQLCHIAWSLAVLRMGGRRQLLDRVCEAFSEKLWEGVPQDLSTFSWSLAALLLQGHPAFDVTMRASLERLSEFGVQDLAISAWSLSKLLYTERRPLLTAIAKESQLKLQEFGGRNLSSLSWVIGCEADPVRAAAALCLSYAAMEKGAVASVRMDVRVGRSEQLFPQLRKELGVQSVDLLILGSFQGDVVDHWKPAPWKCERF